ncbi:ccr4 associated factor [Puttea exsequens]|nr:ccr4 associated factor [Puttea exsequens]
MRPSQSPQSKIAETSKLFRKSYVCHRCLSTYQFDPPSSPPSRTGSAFLASRRLLFLYGHDAPRFLQGLTTQNIPAAVAQSKHGGFYSAMLNASGRVLHDIFIYPTNHSRWHRKLLGKHGDDSDPGLLIEVDAAEIEGLERHLKRFRLRAKVGIRAVEEGQLGIWSVWGRGSGSESADTHSSKSLSSEEDIGCKDARAPGMGHRVVLPPDVWPQGPSDEFELRSYTLRRLMMGVAEGQGEISKESALPQESNIDYMGGIDFRKGCYVGQELTIRTHHTGVVRKRILPVQLYSAASDSKPPETLAYDQGTDLILPPQGANISRVGRKGRSAGKWLSGIGNVGLALCRLEVMTDTALTGEGSQWSPEHEFKIAWEPDPDSGGGAGEIKVKAFVPGWHKERAENQKLRRI